jgi:hypothetical protein
MRFVFLALIVLFLEGCSSIPNPYQRVFLDSSKHEDDPPNWVQVSKLIWEDDGKMFLKTSHTVRGDERVDGCYELARLDARENMLSEISQQLRGSVDNAQTSLSENAEVVLGKVRSTQFGGRIRGLRHLEQYFERYRIGESERIECHVLSAISQADWKAAEKHLAEEVKEVDAKIKSAITNKQAEFFGSKAQANPASRESAQAESNRVPAAEPKASEEAATSSNE